MKQATFPIKRICTRCNCEVCDARMWKLEDGFRVCTAMTRVYGKERVYRYVQCGLDVDAPVTPVMEAD